MWFPSSRTERPPPMTTRPPSLQQRTGGAPEHNGPSTSFARAHNHTVEQIQPVSPREDWGPIGSRPATQNMSAMKLSDRHQAQEQREMSGQNIVINRPAQQQHTQQAPNQLTQQNTNNLAMIWGNNTNNQNQVQGTTLQRCPTQLLGAYSRSQRRTPAPSHL